MQYSQTVFCRLRLVQTSKLFLMSIFFLTINKEKAQKTDYTVIKPKESLQT